ncbi:hypothetical protein N9059_01740 [bacterium]|nr:hypothetical protein [bacterium]
MNSLFDSLKLSAGERRLIMFMSVVVFVILNVWFVWPHRNRYQDLLQGIDSSKQRLAQYEDASMRLPGLETDLEVLESQGAVVLTSDQGIHFLRSIQSQVATTGIKINRWEEIKNSRGGTNDFFIEKTMPLSYSNTDDENLLKFLESLGGDASLIRVLDLTIKPAVNRQTLAGRVTLVASYQK